VNDLFLPGSIEDKATLSQWLHYLATIHHRPIDKSLDRVFAVAHRMGLQ
jgi:folylpolyglutamate synthase/dihydropteroate synthase